MDSNNSLIVVIVVGVFLLVVYNRLLKYKLHKKVVSLIKKWKPKGLNTEKEYENSLYKYLHENLQEQITKQYSLGRTSADIVVGDKVLIEIKHNLHSTSQFQRLRGQLQDYMDKWKGTLVLLLCGDTEPNIKKDIESYVQKVIKEDGLGESKKLDLLHKK